MSNLIAAKRYARALYQITKASGTSEKVLTELRVLKKVSDQDKAIKDLFSSPLVSIEKKSTAVKGALEGKITAELLNVLLLMTEKGRLELIPELCLAFENICDEDHNITRGNVKSAAPLSSEARNRIESLITSVIHKKVILTFTEDPKILGGTVANVAGWSFDDSIEMHLGKIKEELNRRAN